MLMNQYGIRKKPHKDDMLKLRNLSLRKLIYVARCLGRNPFKLEFQEIDKIIMDGIKCNRRTAYEYRTAILEICHCFLS